MFGASYPTVPHEFESKKIIPASWLNDNYNALNNAITDGTAKINVNEIEINGSKLIGADKNLIISELTVTGNMTIEGDQEIEGNQFIDGDQVVAGNQFIDGDTVISGNLTITGNQTIRGVQIISTVNANYLSSPTLRVDSVISTVSFSYNYDTIYRAIEDSFVEWYCDENGGGVANIVSVLCSPTSNPTVVVGRKIVPANEFDYGLLVVPKNYYWKILFANSPIGFSIRVSKLGGR
jgi:hypothetical protein